MTCPLPRLPTQLLLAVLTLSQLGCASKRTLAEREAVATYNRCLMALKTAEVESYQHCLSSPAKLKFEQELAAQADPAPVDRLAWMRGVADGSPYRTQILRVELSQDLNRAVLETANRSGVLDEPVDHHETIVLVKESGRWVIDKDCCEYSNARFASPVNEAAPETAPMPQ